MPTDGYQVLPAAADPIRIVPLHVPAGVWQKVPESAKVEHPWLDFAPINKGYTILEPQKTDSDQMRIRTNEFEDLIPKKKP